MVAAGNAGKPPGNGQEMRRTWAGQGYDTDRTREGRGEDAAIAGSRGLARGARRGRGGAANVGRAERGSGRPAPRSRERRARWRSGAHHLHEQAAGLADTAGGAQDGDLVTAGLLHRLGGGAGNAGGAEKSGHGVSGEGLRCRRG